MNFATGPVLPADLHSPILTYTILKVHVTILLHLIKFENKKQIFH